MKNAKLIAKKIHFNSLFLLENIQISTTIKTKLKKPTTQ
ncbi:hypothetical protein BFV94_2051 [Alteromonas macleodii]|uniref:Uncharacterized protein n=1 Tax=Alteromonas macleodii TaxID=28108 RepID=A0AB36FS78_ALTMA|nr:hypothetical protein BFV95_2051 [Alteromonas macleodii]OES32630.1 hypothetical protein BFV94_2051 [Alteromonas macleodii]OES32718.1 hypothetical protein BFV93_2043 [Alteromonas macleodii]OES41366.1 hypothetical protein BFV96_2037 [Alteromonas macleodii]